MHHVTRLELARAAIRGLASSTILFVTVLAVALLDLWVAPHSRGELDVLGVHVRQHGQHAVSLSAGGILWWLLGWPILAMALRLRGPESARRITSPALRLTVVVVTLLLTAMVAA
jgi:hypothetical protein